MSSLLSLRMVMWGRSTSVEMIGSRETILLKKNSIWKTRWCFTWQPSTWYQNSLVLILNFMRMRRKSKIHMEILSLRRTKARRVQEPYAECSQENHRLMLEARTRTISAFQLSHRPTSLILPNQNLEWSKISFLRSQISFDQSKRMKIQQRGTSTF